MNILIIHSDLGESAAYRLEELIHSDENYEDRIDVIKWGEKQWNDNRYSQDGEVSSYTIFIGELKANKPIKKISNILFEKYGIVYSVSGNKAVLTANSKILRTSKSDYKSFLDELSDLSPNRIDNATFGARKAISFMKRGIKGIVTERNNIQEQQLLYGVTVFFKNDFYKFIKESD